MSEILKLKKRKEFVRVAKRGDRVVTTSLVLQAAPALSGTEKQPRFGYTTTKKIGHAVVRNRARRRMRAAVRDLREYAHEQTDYVLIGRFSTAECPFETLRKDLKFALKRINKNLYGESHAEVFQPASDSAD